MTMRVGAHVWHMIYGEGVIQEVSISGIVTVAFESRTFRGIPGAINLLTVAEWHQEQRERVNALLRKGRFEDADRVFNQFCVNWWDVAGYHSTRDMARRALVQAERQELKDEVHTLFMNGKIKEADQIFNDRCADWWRESDYKKQREDARLRTLEMERQVLKARVLSLLERGRIEGADRLFNEKCASWWGAADYDSRRDVAYRTFSEGEHQRLIYKIRALLMSGRTEMADRLFGERCAEWWDTVDYERYRLQFSVAYEAMRQHVSCQLLQVKSKLSNRDLELSPEHVGTLIVKKIGAMLARYQIALDKEQRLACARPDRSLLIGARAGSGKTRTLAAIAALAIDDEQLDPDQVLVLAFNTKAAKEIGDRIRDMVGADDYLNARTFHSLAYRIVGAKRKELIFDDGKGDPSRRKQSQFIERTLRGILNPAFKENLYEFFRRELEQIERTGADLPEAEYFAFRRSMELVALNGDRVKSNGEKFIGDFLFEHGIQYKYERVFSWDRKDHVNGSPYRPDFSINAAGRDFIIEHWAIDPDDLTAEVPGWWDTDSAHYRRQIVDKREFWAQRGTPLIETHAGMLHQGRGAFEAELHVSLERAGITCVRLGHGELVRRVAENPGNISRMAELFLSFIQRAKKRRWSVEEVTCLLAENPDPEPRNRLFHQLALRAYGEYERLLEADGAMDYDDLMAMAADEVVERGGAATIALSRDKVIAIRDLRWLLIDEFQDFSELYYRLIDAILKANSGIRMVAVGDDWQAINGFAGAQLKFFENFADYFPGGGRVGISTNYRSASMIVGAGNRIMTGRGQPAAANEGRPEGATIEVRAIDKCFVEFRAASEHADTRKRDAIYFVETSFASGEPQAKGPSVTEQQAARALKECAEFIVESAWRDDSGRLWLVDVLVLARSGFVYGLELHEFERRLRRILDQHPALADAANGAALDVMTAHKAKGKEADTVIVLDATARQFPKLHVDNVLFQPFGVTVEDTLAEERRLFYVAITRAKHRLLLLTESGQESLFLKELQLEQGVGELESLASRRGTSAKPPPMSEIGQQIQARIDAIDRWDLIIGNASRGAVPALERMRDEGHEPPQLGCALRVRSESGDINLHAEFAWPDLHSPVAILSGRHVAHVGHWRNAGWRVFQGDEMIQHSRTHARANSACSATRPNSPAAAP